MYPYKGATMLTFKEIDIAAFSKELSAFIIENDEQAIALEEYAAALVEQEYEGDITVGPVIDYIEMVLDKYKAALPEQDVSGADVLRFLMNQHGHAQKDLSHLISPSTLSKVLNGNRKLSREHMEKLGEYYHVSAIVFF